MSFNNVNRLKSENLSFKTVYAFDKLGSRVPVASYLLSIDTPKESETTGFDFVPSDPSTSVLVAELVSSLRSRLGRIETVNNSPSAEYINTTPTNRKRISGGVISGRAFPSR